MAEPSIRNPKLIDGVWFPVRYVEQYHCFEDARHNMIGCSLVGLIATSLAGKARQSSTAGSSKVSDHMLDALQLIARHSCENFTTGPGSCWTSRPQGRGAQYTADAWCLPCVALAAIQEHQSTPALTQPLYVSLPAGWTPLGLRQRFASKNGVYSRCAICDSLWYENDESHKPNCWIAAVTGSVISPRPSKEA